MIISVLVGKSELRDIEIDAEMCIGDLLTGLFPGVSGCAVYNANGEALNNARTFGECEIMNGDILTVKGGSS